MAKSNFVDWAEFLWDLSERFLENEKKRNLWTFAFGNTYIQICVLLILKGAKLLGTLSPRDFLVSKSRTYYKFLTFRSPNLGKSQKVSFCTPIGTLGLVSTTHNIVYFLELFSKYELHGWIISLIKKSSDFRPPFFFLINVNHCYVKYHNLIHWYNCL